MLSVVVTNWLSWDVDLSLVHRGQCQHQIPQHIHIRLRNNSLARSSSSLSGKTGRSYKPFWVNQQNSNKSKEVYLFTLIHIQVLDIIGLESTLGLIPQLVMTWGGQTSSWPLTWGHRDRNTEGVKVSEGNFHVKMSECGNHDLPKVEIWKVKIVPWQISHSPLQHTWTLLGVTFMTEWREDRSALTLVAFHLIIHPSFAFAEPLFNIKRVRLKNFPTLCCFWNNCPHHLDWTSHHYIHDTLHDYHPDQHLDCFAIKLDSFFTFPPSSLVTHPLKTTKSSGCLTLMG